jgi:lantibiotic biosynthesis protein
MSIRRCGDAMRSDPSFLDAAATIGRRVCLDAVWHDGRCAWMGAVADPALPGRPEQRALGPDLYDGTAGVGLYLAQLAAVTGDEQLRRTALGALGHALARASRLAPERRDGFHAGVLGIVCAATRAARLLGAEELLELARATVRKTSAPPSAARCPDLLTGAAGRIVGLLVLSAALDEVALLDAAVVDGDRLLDAASVSRRGWSWNDPASRRPGHLCGLAHGAAGIGWALVELFAATEEDRFRVAALGAFAYERAQAITTPHRGTWCHGEAGIALSRLRALAVLGAGPHEDDADLALATTHGLLAEALPHELRDLSPCHGLAGAADVLLCAADASADRWGAGADVATDLGHAALERYDAERGAWPCGIPNATTPSLFLGSSGIGWLFLRLYDRAIDSPLQLHIPLTAAFSEA